VFPKKNTHHNHLFFVKKFSESTTKIPKSNMIEP
jgi:hypothetical protein